MRKMICVFLVMLILVGCGNSNDDLQRAMDIRAALQDKKVHFSAEITADYGDVCYTFAMDCDVEKDGSLDFTVTKPDTLSGIRGNISAVGGDLQFEDMILAFETMAEGRICPVSSPWVMMKALRSGFLIGCSTEEDLLRIAVEDSYEDNAMRLDIWVDGNGYPVASDIYWDGRRLLSLTITNFAIL